MLLTPQHLAKGAAEVLSILNLTSSRGDQGAICTGLLRPVSLSWCHLLTFSGEPCGPTQPQLVRREKNDIGQLGPPRQAALLYPHRHELWQLDLGVGWILSQIPPPPALSTRKSDRTAAAMTGSPGTPPLW